MNHRAVSVTIATGLATIINVLLACPLQAYPHLTEAQAAALTPCPPDLVPRIGTFWSLTRTNYPPKPTAPRAALPIYALPDGSYLVDDSSVDFFALAHPVNPVKAARSILSTPGLPREGNLRQQLFSQASAFQLPWGTNRPPQDEPPAPQLVPPELVPARAAFWSMQRSNYPPTPYDRFPQCDVWRLSNGAYLIDDTSIDYSALDWGDGPGGADWGGTPSYPSGTLWLSISNVSGGMANVVLHGTVSGTVYTVTSKQSLLSGELWTAEQEVTGADGQDWTPAQIRTFARQNLYLWAHIGTDTPQRLWLQAISVSNGYFNFLLIGTMEGQTYEIRSKTSLTDAEWGSEGTVTGSSNQFWTVVTVQTQSRSNLFIQARNLSQDTDGQGLPDWWQLYYFGHTGVDPYMYCPSGDGWTVLEAYRNNWSPTNFYTPPAPRNLAVSLSQSNWTVTISWQPPAGGNVAGYTIIRGDSVNYQPTYFYLGPTNRFVDAGYPPYVNPAFGPETYSMQANYAQGGSAWAYVYPFPSPQAGPVSTFTATGPADSTLLGLTAVPAGASFIRLTRVDLDYSQPLPRSHSVGTNIDLPVSLFASNLVPYPAALVGSGPDGGMALS